MKTFVIIALSLSISSSLYFIFKAIDENDDGAFISGTLRLIVMILALIFTCIGWR